MSALSEQMVILSDKLAFSASKRAIDELQRVVAYSWPTQERIGREPALQWTGKGKESITISGVIFTTFRPGDGEMIGLNSVEEIRELAAEGEVYTVVMGYDSGSSVGQFVITNIEQSDSLLLANGAPQKQTYSVTLESYGEDGLAEQAST